MVAYLLDTNTFVTAKNSYYAFDVCPGFWTSILVEHKAGNIVSIDRVKAEIVEGNDRLKRWVEKRVPATMFGKSNTSEIASSVSDIMNWVQTNGFDQPGVKSFAAKADPWLIAYALQHGMELVTHEIYNANTRRKVPIPNVCKHFGVKCTSIFETLRVLQVRFGLRKKPL